MMFKFQLAPFRRRISAFSTTPTRPTIPLSRLALEPLNQISGSPIVGEVPILSHDLDFVITKKGPHLLPTPWPIAHAQKFKVNLQKPDRKATKNQPLSALASLHSLSYYASASSITSALALLHSHLLQKWTLNTRDFFSTPRFSTGNKSPSSRLSDAVVIDIVPRKDSSYEGTSYAIEAVSFSTPNSLLSNLGSSLERLLTKPDPEYRTSLSEEKKSLSEEKKSLSEEKKSLPEEKKSLSKEKKSLPEEKKRPSQDAKEGPKDAYHYAKCGPFLLRAQIDCQDPRLPRKTFDIKTRATAAVRMSTGPPTQATLSYRLNRTKGEFESIEREDYDLLRSAFLKYSLQARIGHMDGILVAYHNTQELFGFQYLSLPQISELLFGSEHLGLQVFETSMGLLQIVLDRAVQMYPKQRLRVLLSKASGNGLQVVVSPRSRSSPLKARPPKSFHLSFRQTLNGRELFEFPRLRDPVTDSWEVFYNLQEADAPQILDRKAMETAGVLVLKPSPVTDESSTSFFYKAMAETHC